MIKKTNCINETINVLEGNEDEIEWNMGEYGEGQSNYNQNPEAINERLMSLTISKEFLHSKNHCKQNQKTTKIYAEKKHYKS